MLKQLASEVLFIVNVFASSFPDFIRGIKFLADVPASAAYYGSYEIIQRAMVPEGGDRSQLGLGRTILAGGTAGIFNWIVALPVDVLKSRLQSGANFH